MNNLILKFTPVGLFACLIVVVVTGFQMKARFERDIVAKDSLSRVLSSELADVEKQLELCNRKVLAQRYAVCTILSGKYQYAPAIFASLQQFDGMTQYAYSHMPMKQLVCECDTFTSTRTVRKPKPISTSEPPKREDF